MHNLYQIWYVWMHLQLNKLFSKFDFPRIQFSQNSIYPIWESFQVCILYGIEKKTCNTYWKSHDTYLLTIDGILRYTKVIEHMSKINGIYVFVQVPGLTST